MFWVLRELDRYSRRDRQSVPGQQLMKGLEQVLGAVGGRGGGAI